MFRNIYAYIYRNLYYIQKYIYIKHVYAHMYMQAHIVLYVHAIYLQLMKQDMMNLKQKGEEYMGGLEERKEMENYIYTIISKLFK